jgi:hypothetical protein
VAEQQGNIAGGQTLLVVQLIQADQRLLWGHHLYPFGLHATLLEQVLCQIIANRKPAQNQQSVKSATRQHCRMTIKICNEPCKRAMQIGVGVDDLSGGIVRLGGRSDRVIVSSGYRA